MNPVHRLCSLLLIALSTGLLQATISHPASAAPPRTAFLRLTNDDEVSGELLDSGPESGQRFRWQIDGFNDPTRIDPAYLRSVSFSSPNQLEENEAAKNETDKRIRLLELHNGQRLVGRVESLEEGIVTFRSQSAGSVRLPLSEIASLYRWDATSQSLNLGRNALENQENAEAWKSRGNRLSTSAENATLRFADVLPENATIEFEIAWDGKSNFEIAIGVDPDAVEKTLVDAFRLAVWDGQLVFYRESEEIADVVSLGKLSEWKGRAKLRIDLNREFGQSVVSIDSKPGSEWSLRDFPVDGPNPSGIWIKNFKGAFRLESLLVMPLLKTGQTNQESQAAVFFRIDEDPVSGTLVEINEGEWTVDDGGKETVLDADAVSFVRFASPESSKTSEMESDEDEDGVGPETDAIVEGIPSVRIVTRSGEQFFGGWSSVRANNIHLRSPSFQEEVLIPIDQLIRIDRDGEGNIGMTTREEAKTRQLCKLDLESGMVTGRFQPAKATEVNLPLAFEPTWGSAIAVQTSFRGQAVFGALPYKLSPSDLQRRAREQARQLREAQVQQVDDGVAQFNMMNMFTNAFGKDAQAALSNPKAMYLRSGEVVPFESVTIQNEEVSFESRVIKQSRIPCSEILALRLRPGSFEPVLEEVLRERFMTVPRVNKKDPPSHLVVAANGDLLRCRLISLGQTHLLVESRLEKIRIKRSLVSQVIWLTSPKTDDAAKPPVPNQKGVSVLAILKDGSRVAMQPRELSGDSLVGEHPYLGESNVKLSETVLLSFNGFLTEKTGTLPYSDWKLADAPEPTIAGEEGDGDAGKSSRLVGKPAPEFKLELLDGETFTLSRNRGKVVVLDFWATWCGPCMQAMPVIEETVNGYDDADVRLVAVNLQEKPDAISKTLDRLGIEPEVALDIDGVAAILYEANAIPQTVVIDKKGVVTRVFVGSGGNLGEQLKTAIDECINETQPATP
ncbi:MAG: TlpA disulfide reductase family protein [Planctomycetota bacterium]